VDIAIARIVSFETWAIRNQSERIGDGFESHVPAETVIYNMIYKQTNRFSTVATRLPEITKQMIASLEEITVTQEIIGRKTELLF